MKRPRQNFDIQEYDINTKNDELAFLSLTLRGRFGGGLIINT
jgi:hypothetical protein